MQQRPLGKTGLSVAPIGLGTVTLGRSAGLKLATPARIPSDDEAIALLEAARDLGVNLIDTAPAYGTSEERLGKLLPRVAPRERWVLCTKVGEEFDPSAAASRYDFSPSAIVASVNRSLARLRTEALDVVLLHFSSSVDDGAVLERGEALQALGELKRAGKVRAIGASTSTVRGGLAAVSLGADVVMITLNQSAQEELAVLEAARGSGVGVLVKKALAGGRLGETSLAWVLQQPGVGAAVMGTTNPEHLRKSAGAVW